MPDDYGNPLPGEEGYVAPVGTETDTTSPSDTTALSGTTAEGGPEDSVALSDVQSGYQGIAEAVSPDAASTSPTYTNPADNVSALDINTGTDYLTPETTVAGQLSRLLDQGGEVQQQNRVDSKQRASALGMMSSSAAVGASRRADIKALQPIAAQDAKTASQFRLQEQATENEIQKIQVEAEVSGALTEQKYQIQEKSTRITQEWEATMRGMDAETQTMMTDLQGKWETSLKTLEADITRELQQQEIDSNVEQSILNTAHESMNNYQITIQQLLANESFLDNFAGNTEAMAGYFDDLFVTVESSIRYSAKAAGIYPTMQPYIDELVAANRWDSTDMGSGTPTADDEATV